MLNQDQKVCFEYPLNSQMAGHLAIVEDETILSNICESNRDIISAPIFKIGDETEGFDSGITKLGLECFLVISSHGFYIGIFDTRDIANNCYSTALTLEESFAKMYKKASK